MQQLSSVDAQFLALEDGRNHAHVSTLAIYDQSTAPGGKLTLEAISELIADRLHLLPPFRWRLAEVPLGIDYPYWVDDTEFDLDFHIRELALPAPGDERMLTEQVARLVSRPLDRSHPLWELYLIHGLADDRVAVLTKFHHAAVDGASGAEILGILLDTEPGRPRPEAEPGRRPRGDEMPSQLQMLGRGLAGVPRQPLRAIRAVPKALPHLDQNPMLRHLPGIGTVAGRQPARPAGAAADQGRRRARGPQPARAADDPQPADLAAPPTGALEPVAGRDQADQEATSGSPSTTSW